MPTPTTRGLGGSRWRQGPHPPASVLYSPLHVVACVTRDENREPPPQRSPSNARVSYWEPSGSRNRSRPLGGASHQRDTTHEPLSRGSLKANPKSAQLSLKIMIHRKVKISVTRSAVEHLNQDAISMGMPFPKCSPTLIIFQPFNRWHFGRWEIALPCCCFLVCIDKRGGVHGCSDLHLCE